MHLLIFSGFSYPTLPGLFFHASHSIECGDPSFLLQVAGTTSISLMQTFKEKYGPVALIAGASEGLGAAWAEALAKRGLDLVLIARRKERLDEIVAGLVSKYKIRTWSLPCDLATPDAAKY